MNQDSSTRSQQSSRAEDTALILTACIISSLLVYLVYLRSYIFGSELGHWVYPYLSSLPFFPEWILLTVLLLLVAFVLLGNKLINSHERITLMGLLLLAILIQSLIRGIYPFSMSAVIQSDTANSFYTPAISYSAAEVLSEFSTLAPSFPLHARSNMPGKILLFELLNVFTSSPEIMGYLIIALSSVGALLLYGICKRLFHDRKIAFYALTLYVLVPSKLFFFPILNTVTPVFMLLCFYLLVVYLDNKHLTVAWMLGVSFFILALFEPSPLITGIVMIGITIYAMREKQLARNELYRLLIHASLAFLAVNIVFYVFFSFNFFKSFLSILNDARSFNVNDGRGYLIWIIENSREFIYGAGLPVTIIFMYMAILVIAQTNSPRDLAQLSLENILVLCLLVNFLVLLLLGINRGEITRLWIYLAVLFQVPAAIFIARIQKGLPLFLLVVSLLAIQSMVTLHRVGFVFP